MRILSREEREAAEQEHRDLENAPQSKIFSKYQLVNAVKAYDAENGTELFAALYQQYVTNMEFQFYWNTVTQLDLANDDYNRLVTTFNLTNEQINGILSHIS